MKCALLYILGRGVESRCYPVKLRHWTSAVIFICAVKIYVRFKNVLCLGSRGNNCSFTVLQFETITLTNNVSIREAIVES